MKKTILLTIALLSGYAVNSKPVSNEFKSIMKEYLMDKKHSSLLQKGIV